MKIDISEQELTKAIKMLRMLENFPFTETNDSNLMDKQYQLTLEHIIQIWGLYSPFYLQKILLLE